MSVDRRQMLGLAAAAALMPRAAAAQRSVPLVAAMIGGRPPPDPSGVDWSEAVRVGLAGQGFVDGSNVRCEFRFTAGEPSVTALYAEEVVALRPDVILTGTTENAVAVQRLTRTIPLVFVAVALPIEAGLVAGYARPGGNATGVSHLEPSVGGKLVELLMEVAPRTRNIAYLTNPDTAPAEMLAPATAAAQSYSVTITAIDVRSTEAVAPVIAEIASWEGPGIVLPGNNWVHNNAAPFVTAINAHRIPAVYPSHRMVEAGGLLGIGVEIEEMFQIGGDYVGRILEGADPAIMPVRAAPFSTILNLRTAEQLGINVPLTVIVSASRFVE
jgi:putative ABC transport system substrate-binding protein